MCSDKLQTLYTSGTVFHTFLGESCPAGSLPPRWFEDRGELMSCPIINAVADLLHLC